MYRTYSYNDMPIPVQRRNEDMRKPMPPPKKEIECKEEKIEKKFDKPDNGGILSGLGTDDLILIVVALVLRRQTSFDSTCIYIFIGVVLV